MIFYEISETFCARVSLRPPVIADNLFIGFVRESGGALVMVVAMVSSPPLTG